MPILSIRISETDHARYQAAAALSGARSVGAYIKNRLEAKDRLEEAINGLRIEVNSLMDEAGQRSTRKELADILVLLMEALLLVRGMAQPSNLEATSRCLKQFGISKWKSEKPIIFDK